jgi:hypothetical protein
MEGTRHRAPKKRIAEASFITGSAITIDGGYLA